MSALVYPPRPTIHESLAADEPEYDPYSGDTEIFETPLAIAIVDIGADDSDFDWRDGDEGGR